MTSAHASLFAHHRARVLPEWIDYNGHMNVAFYVLAFDQASDALLDHVGLGESYRAATGCSIYVLEMHVTYEQELKVDTPIAFTTQILDHDEKRIHVFHRMCDAGGQLAATNELLCLHVDTASGRSAPMPPDALAAVRTLHDLHAVLARPPQAGRIIGVRAGRP